MLNRSFAVRVSAYLTALLIICFGALIVVADGFFTRAVTAKGEAHGLSVARLVSAQMSRGVKWGKADALARLAQPLLAPASGENLAQIIVFDAEGGVLLSELSDPSVDTSPPERAADPADAMSEPGAPRWEDALAALGDADVALGATGPSSLQPAFAAIIDEASGERIGAAVFVWDLSAQRAEIMEKRLTLVATGFGGLIAAVAALILILRAQAVSPIIEIQGALRRLADGDVETPVPTARRGDEIGEMAAAVAVLRDNAIAANVLEAEKLEANRQAETEREKARAAREKAEEDERRRKEADVIAREREAENRRIAEKREAEREAARREEASRLAEEQRRATLADLSDAFGEIVEAASRGDFSRRVEKTFDDPEISRLAEGLNLMARTVEDGLTETRAVLAAVGEYDLSRRIVGAYEGDFAALRDGVNGAVDTLREIVERMQDGTTALKARTGPLNEGFARLAQRATEQAARVQQTAAAVEMLGQSVEENAARARRAREDTVAAAKKAGGGGEIMAKATSVMDRVAKSSDQIAAIVELIDNIAFQTNLLSLNASVEAARAGKAGAGFAVVAAEVRNLAQTTANSNNEIRALIERSRLEVGDGVQMVNQAADMLGEIAANIKSASEISAQISEETGDQADRLGEIRSVVREFDAATQQSAELATSSTEALAEAVAGVERIDEVAQAFSLARRSQAAA